MYIQPANSCIYMFCAYKPCIYKWSEFCIYRQAAGLVLKTKRGGIGKVSCAYNTVHTIHTTIQEVGKEGRR